MDTVNYQCTMTSPHLVQIDHHQNSGHLLRWCCHVSDTLPEYTVISLPPGWVDPSVGQVDISINHLSQLVHGHSQRGWSDTIMTRWYCLESTLDVPKEMQPNPLNKRRTWKANGSLPDSGIGDMPHVGSGWFYGVTKASSCLQRVFIYYCIKHRILLSDSWHKRCSAVWWWIKKGQGQWVFLWLELVFCIFLQCCDCWLRDRRESG